jgi:cohesin loading factor subunit SCC2
LVVGHKKFGLCISDESSAEESSGCSELDDDEDNKVPWQSNEHKNATLYRLIEIRKQFLVGKIRPFQDNVGAGNRTQVLQTYIDYESAELISRYLASKRPFSQSFDRYLQQVSMK